MKGGKHGRVKQFPLGVKMNIDFESVCQIRTETGLPCNNCKFADTCQTYREKEKKKDEKKQGRTGRKKGV